MVKLKGRCDDMGKGGFFGLSFGIAENPIVDTTHTRCLESSRKWCRAG